MKTLGVGARDLAGLAAEVTGRGRSLRFRVKGGSMHPALGNGDQVVVAPADARHLQHGDVVLLGGNQPRIHRLVRFDRLGGFLITRGDALVHDDLPEAPGQVIGRVVGVEKHVPGRLRSLLGQGVRFLRGLFALPRN